MSSKLDKSLDDIISSKPRATRRKVPGGVRKGPIRKRPTEPRKPARATTAKTQAKVEAVSSLNPLREAQNMADRIIISNLV